MNIFNQIFNLRKGEDDRQKTLADIRKNISFTGANVWILACAIIIASIGLNINSTAVIIGAMLISPLMGPIVGAGFALGIYDFDLLKKSFRNLLIATVTGLSVSAIYFFISPFKEAQSEILARTTPNIYDVLIAFSGGIVGVIAVTRVEKGNPIPGVAIATALMPPLCTAGYGLATGHYRYFFGSLFLYSINCVFICSATFIIVKSLKYPSKIIEEKHKRQVKIFISAIVLCMLVPSAYFAFSLYKQQKFKDAVNAFIDQEFIQKGYTLVYKKADYNSTPSRVEVAFLSTHFKRNDIREINKNLSDFGLDGTRLIIRQDSTFDVQEIKNDILNEFKSNEAVLTEKDIRIKLLEGEIAKNFFDNKTVMQEAEIIFPEITSLAIANHTFYNRRDSNYVMPVLLYTASKPLNAADTARLKNWAMQRLNLKVLEVYERR